MFYNIFSRRITKRALPVRVLNILLALAISYSGWSQQTSSPAPEGYAAQENLNALAGSGSGMVRTYDKRYEGVKGSPYAFAAWREGDLFLHTQQRLHFNELNYNCFSKELIYREEAGGQVLILNKYIVDFFTVSSPDSMVFVPVRLPGDADISFVRLLYSGNSSLYLAYEKEYLKADYTGGYSANRPYDEYIDKHQYFMLTAGSDEPLRIKGSKKSLAEQFGTHSKEMLSYFNSGKTEFRDIEYLVAMLRYYDELVNKK